MTYLMMDASEFVILSIDHNTNDIQGLYCRALLSMEKGPDNKYVRLCGPHTSLLHILCLFMLDSLKL